MRATEFSPSPLARHSLLQASQPPSKSSVSLTNPKAGSVSINLKAHLICPRMVRSLMHTKGHVLLCFVACSLTHCVATDNSTNLPSAQPPALRTFDTLKPLAEKGDAAAQADLGICFINGDGVKKDLQEAIKWFRNAADQGNPAGQQNLGMCYYQGEGVPKNLAEAAKWFRKAAGAGDPNA